MNPAGRWPWHPPPHEGEALTSWLHRIAAGFALTPRQLLNEPGGPAVTVDEMAGLDVQAPAAVIALLAGRTGVSPDDVRSLTLAGWVPWLLDSVTPDPTGRGFVDYVDSVSVLLRPGRQASRCVPGWRAWLSEQPLRRACRDCSARSLSPAATLVTQIPLTLSCMQHRCWLEEYLGVLGGEVFWPDRADGTKPVSDAVAVQDARTWQALTTGAVDLPERRVHAGVWFRLLRRLLDEVNTPPSQCGAQVAASRQAWESAGLPFRAGQYRWHPYESLTWTIQQQMLQATAAAVALIEAGEIPARGHHGSLFHPLPGPPVFAGDRPKPPARDCAYYFLLATRDAEDAIQAARRDRAAARQLFHLCTYSTTDEARIDRVRGLFVELGISLDDASHNSGHTTLCTP